VADPSGLEHSLVIGADNWLVARSPQVFPWWIGPGTKSSPAQTWLQAIISVGTVNDDFIKNLVRSLCEARAGFGVIGPLAFVRVALA
jgi:hypothetical protein